MQYGNYITYILFTLDKKQNNLSENSTKALNKINY